MCNYSYEFSFTIHNVTFMMLKLNKELHKTEPKLLKFLSGYVKSAGTSNIHYEILSNIFECKHFPKTFLANKSRYI